MRRANRTVIPRDNATVCGRELRIFWSKSATSGSRCPIYGGAGALRDARVGVGWHVVATAYAVARYPRAVPDTG
eukprot:2298708-Rhodomonas_salina.3